MDNYTLTGLTRGEVESIGQKRYFAKHWKRNFLPALIGFVMVVAAGIFDSGSIAGRVVFGIGAAVTVGFMINYNLKSDRAGRSFFKEVTSK
jgi:hypothetical protein